MTGYYSPARYMVLMLLLYIHYYTVQTPSPRTIAKNA